MLQARHLREHCYRMAIDEHHQEQGFLSESMRQHLAEPRSVGLTVGARDSKMMGKVDKDLQARVKRETMIY